MCTGIENIHLISMLFLFPYDNGLRIRSVEQTTQVNIIANRRGTSKKRPYQRGLVRPKLSFHREAYVHQWTVKSCWCINEWVIYINNAMLYVKYETVFMLVSARVPMCVMSSGCVCFLYKTTQFFMFETVITTSLGPTYVLWVFRS